MRQSHLAQLFSTGAGEILPPTSTRAAPPPSELFFNAPDSFSFLYSSAVNFLKGNSFAPFQTSRALVTYFSHSLRFLLLRDRKQNKTKNVRRPVRILLVILRTELDMKVPSPSRDAASRGPSLAAEKRRGGKQQLLQNFLWTLQVINTIGLHASELGGLL